MKLIPLSKKGKHAGKYHAIVDDDMYEELNQHNWNYSAGYARRCVSKINGKYVHILMHRQIINTSSDIDHINRNKLDNRRENLRVANDSQNNSNQHLSKKNTSGYKGVFLYKHKNRPNWTKWKAEIQVNGKKIYLGYFNTREEAAHAYDAASKKYHGEYGYLNFPEDAL